MSLPPRRTQRRLLSLLFASSGLARIGFIATVTVVPLIAEDLTGSASLAGVPLAVSTIGIAVGTAPISALMAKSGRRAGITAGLGIATAGIALATTAIGLRWFPLFVAAMFIFGFGVAADRLSRYAAADISAPERRSFAISIVVWAGTIGAVAGPLILEPSEKLAEALGLEGLAGPPLVSTAILVVAAAIVLAGLRPDPMDFQKLDSGNPSWSIASARPLLRAASVRYAVAVLITSQVVMVLVMAMAPVHIRRAGEGLGIVGLVIGAHTFGMFAVSPVTGVLADRFGRLPVMSVGLAMLALSGVLAASAEDTDRGMLVASMFLVGFGWNLGFVAGSAFLTEGVPNSARVPLEGLADATVWASSAVAGLASGFLLEATSFAFLSLAGSTMVIVPVLMRLRYRRILVAPVGASH